MIETDEQRRWWFATHPEYSWSRRGIQRGEHGHEEHEPPAHSPEEIDAYVAEGLKYFPTGPVAALLKALKWGLGTNDGPTPLDVLFRGTDLDEAQHNPEDESADGKKPEDERKDSVLDSVLKGIWNSFQGKDPREPLYVVLSAGKLRREMIKDNRPIPDDHAAHHIVPEYDRRFPEAGEARRILEKYQIDLNSSSNGVALPNKPGIPEGGYHPKIHNREYYRKVLDLLHGATTKEEAIGTLKKIADQLSKSQFPK